MSNWMTNLTDDTLRQELDYIRSLYEIAEDIEQELKHRAAEEGIDYEQ